MSLLWKEKSPSQMWIGKKRTWLLDVGHVLHMGLDGPRHPGNPLSEISKVSVLKISSLGNWTVSRTWSRVGIFSATLDLCDGLEGEISVTTL